MMVIPAIDLKDGKCVRLSQGRMDRETIYSEDPVQMAKHWQTTGAERLHVVDLNGAVTGKPFHRALIKQMMESVHIPIEIGGGIRELDTIKDYCSSGAKWVVLGTAALKNPQLLEGACASFPGQIILAIDAKRKGNRWEVYIHGGRTPHRDRCDLLGKTNGRAGSGRDSANEHGS